MAKIAFFIVAALCISQIAAKPSSTSESLQKLNEKTGEVISSLEQTVKKAINIEDTKEIEQFRHAMEENTKALANKLHDILSDVDKEIKAHSGDVEKAVTDLKTKVSEAVTKIQADHPKEAEKAKEFQKQMETLFTDMQSKANEVVTKISADSQGVSEDITKFTTNVMEALKKSGEKIKQDFEKVFDEHKKEHKQ